MLESIDLYSFKVYLMACILSYTAQIIPMKFLFVLLLIPFCALSQISEVESCFKDKGEIYFSFQASSIKQFNEISSLVSIDHGSSFTNAYAYANKQEFKAFLNLELDYKIEENPGFTFEDLNMLLSLDEKQMSDWDFYPSYEVYVEMMYAFEEEYPELCKVSSIGTTINGRELLVAKITDHLDAEEGEPRLLYTSSMHGDEITGFVLSLRLIDYLINNYGVNDRVTEIVNNVEIWINPLANPDGAYTNNNSTVYGATRYNANWVDLNRNYPDPEDGLHPDGNSYQSETLAFMEFADSCAFDISSNFHGGAEVANYPWDTWSQYPADYDWWIHVMHEYADLAQENSSSNYFTSFDDGVTNGYDWYEVNGGRQDYMNYEKHCREFTLELSDSKTPPGSQLPYYWDANYNSFLAYIEQSLYGLHGIVTDSISGEPLVAQILIENHDIDNSDVSSHLPIGDYHRYLASGSYDIIFSAEGYQSKTISSVTVLNNETTVLDVQLAPIVVSVDESVLDAISIYPQPASDFIRIYGCPETITQILLIDSSGKIVKTISNRHKKSIYISKDNLPSGTYMLDFKSVSYEFQKSIILL